MRKLAIVAALVLGLSTLGIATAGADPVYEPGDYIVDVTKVVEGGPEDAHFVIDVCGTPVSFDAEGGSDTVTVGNTDDGDVSCRVVETDSGGANDVEGETTCEFVAPEPYIETTDTKEYLPIEDQRCSVVIENSYDEVTTTTAAPPIVIQEPPIIIERQAPPPQVIVRSPDFTG